MLKLALALAGTIVFVLLVAALCFIAAAEDWTDAGGWTVRAVGLMAVLILLAATIPYVGG